MTHPFTPGRGAAHRDPHDYGEEFRSTDAHNARLGAIFKTESGQVTLTNGRGDKIWFIDTTGGSVGVALPAAADAVSFLYTVKRKTGGANNLIVTPDSGTIDGSAAHSIGTQYQFATYISDGDNYWIVSS